MPGHRGSWVTGFWTILGPDFAGKSTALARLHDEHRWQVVSHDARFVGPYPLVAMLRRCWSEAASARAEKRHTAELVLSVAHSIILHQRDEVTRLGRDAGPEPVIVDSYFYKVLAACSLLGMSHDRTFSYWRSFPRPRGVVYLDVPPEVTWERTQRGADVTGFEHYGDSVSRAGFIRLQHEMRARMLAEVNDLPVTIVDGTAEPDVVLAKIVSVVGGLPR
jgi:thymidylate kinase